MNIKEQLAKATAIYIMELTASPNSLTDRYSAYMLIDGQLQVIWPDFEYKHMGDVNNNPMSTYPIATKESLNGLGMKFSERKQYPAYHFVQRGYGYSKTSEVLNSICEFAGRRIPGFLLTGHSPSPISALASTKLDKMEARN
jgi:hypothetical protein